MWRQRHKNGANAAVHDGGVQRHFFLGGAGPVAAVAQKKEDDHTSHTPHICLFLSHHSSHIIHCEKVITQYTTLTLNRP